MHMKPIDFCLFLWNNFTGLVPCTYPNIVFLHNFFMYNLSLLYIFPEFLKPQDVDTSYICKAKYGYL